MRFLSNGDYIFPFHFFHYWIEHFYIWSYQSGAANPDGIIRLPTRLPEIIMFGLFGNIALGYFYALSSLVIAFVGFFFFAKHFLQIKQVSIQLLGALFFALNPIFLGNISKIGLVLAVAMLPLCFLAIQAAFKHKQMRYLLLYVGCLNVSLVHPYTFTINLVVTGIYFLIMAHTHSHVIRDRLPSLLVVGCVGLLLNAYFVLPLANLGTVDKGALSDSATSTPIDYTSLVEIANTGSIFNAFSLSKDVLKDYEFYNGIYQGFYFLGAFLLYAILFTLYIRSEKYMDRRDKRRFLLVVGLLLLLLVLSTASFLNANMLIKALIGFPGGWMFRSPLKWQLYIPVVLCCAIVLALSYIQKKRQFVGIYLGVVCTFLLMNGYIAADVYTKLFVPRSVNHFSALQNMDLNQKNMLVVNAELCTNFAKENPVVVTELNQVLLSQSIQVKRTELASIGSLDLANYDYVLGCQNTLTNNPRLDYYAFGDPKNLAGDAYQLFTNTKPLPYAYVTSNVFTIEHPKNIDAKQAFAKDQTGEPFAFTGQGIGIGQTIGFQDFFDTITPDNITDKTLSGSVAPDHEKPHTLFVQPHASPFYLTQQDRRITISPHERPDSQIIAPATTAQPLDLTTTGKEPMTVIYDDPTFTYENIIPEPSLEKGLWQDKVGDCNAYDNSPSIGMQRTTAERTTGKAALELWANNHIACTGPNTLSVEPGSHYVLSFDYQAIGGQSAGYNLTFNDSGQTFMGDRLTDKSGEWVTFTGEIAVPADATTAHLMLYAYPSATGKTTGIARYDNLKLIKIPDVKSRFFFLSNMHPPQPSPKVSTAFLNPTKNRITISGARDPFYLSTKETYHRSWQLTLTDRASSGPGSIMPIASAKAADGIRHIKADNTMNGWYIDPAVLCQDSPSACTKQGDGSYNLAMTMEFTPQRWLYLGLGISSITFVGILVYFGLLYRNRKSSQRSVLKR